MQLAIPVYEFATTGGIGRYTREVAAELAQRGHDVTVYTPPTASAIPPGVRVRPLGRGRAPNSAIGAADLLTFGARAALRVPRGAISYGPVGCVWRRGVVTALSVHAAWVRDRREATGEPPNTFDRAMMALERLTWRHPHLDRTALSPRCADDAVSCFGVDRSSITIVPPAIDPLEFAPRGEGEREIARADMNLPPDRYVVGIAANYAFARKHVDLLIDATARLGAVLAVAGWSDRHLSYYEARARATGADVRFLGRIDDMRTFNCALDVFALPSINEAYGMAAHEAMACGVATVVSSRCGIADLLTAGSDAIVVDDLTVGGVTSALTALADPDVRRRVERRGQEWAHRRTWRDVGAEMEAVLLRAAGSSRPAAGVTPPAP